MRFLSNQSKVVLASLTVLGTFLVQNPSQAAQYFVDDFSGFDVGQDIEGLGAVHELLNINAVNGDARAINTYVGAKDNNLWSYQSNDANGKNGGLNLGGFAEVGTNKNNRDNTFEFTFAEGVKVSEFSLLMVDYGDYNAFRADQHNAFLTAYNGADEQVGQVSLSGNGKMAGGDANNTGDSLFGRTNLTVFGEDITKVSLTFDYVNAQGKQNKSFDPFLGFDYVAFTTQDDVTDVPEPASALALLAAGSVGLAGIKRKLAA